jgi:hypothetical protein
MKGLTRPSRFALQFFGSHLRVGTVQSAIPRRNAVVSGRPTQSAAFPLTEQTKEGSLQCSRTNRLILTRHGLLRHWLPTAPWKRGHTL